jgi:transcriptional regulator with XRE-family HTH domain
MQEGWRRLAELIRADAAGRYDSLASMARAAGLSVRTIEDITAGRRRSYRETTLYRIEAALGWEHGSARRLVEGSPVQREIDPVFARVRDAWPRLTERDRHIVLAVVEALAE